MLITDIIIERIETTDAEKATGEVALISQSGTIHVRCGVPEYLSASQDVIHRNLVREAVRQVRRLPEFRNGQTNLAFAPGLHG